MARATKGAMKTTGKIVNGQVHLTEVNYLHLQMIRSLQAPPLSLRSGKNKKWEEKKFD